MTGTLSASGLRAGARHPESRAPLSNHDLVRGRARRRRARGVRRDHALLRGGARGRPRRGSPGGPPRSVRLDGPMSLGLLILLIAVVAVVLVVVVAGLAVSGRRK